MPTGAGVEWQFNLEKAPCWGGIFEGMVKSTQKCSRKVVGQARLNYDELLIVVTEVESIINSRPLCYISSDDLEEPITPSVEEDQLSFPDWLGHAHDTNHENYAGTHEYLTTRLKYRNTVLNQLWKKWCQEYLLEMHEVHHCGKEVADEPTISFGNVVLVHDDKPYGFWRIANINQLLIGKDGLVRGVVVRIISEKDWVTELQWPLQLVYPLEVDCCVSQHKETHQHAEKKNLEDVTINRKETKGGKDLDNLPVGQPQWAAAEQAREKILTLSRDDQCCFSIL